MMSEKRNFTCPETEAPCERRECKRGLCAIQKEGEARRRDLLSANYWGEFSKADVDREMHGLAEVVIKSAYRAKYGKPIAPEMLREKRNEYLRAKHASIATRAREILRGRRSGPSIEDLGL